MIDQVLVRGALVADPELRFTPRAGTTCLSMRLGQSASRWDQDNGRWVKTREHYFDAVVWPVKRGDQTVDLPTMLSKGILSKGQVVVLHGSWQTRKWTNKRGDDVWATEFVADAVYPDAMGLVEWQTAAGGSPREVD